VSVGKKTSIRRDGGSGDLKAFPGGSRARDARPDHVAEPVEPRGGGTACARSTPAQNSFRSLEERAMRIEIFVRPDGNE
jgi:hypothetical protein